MPVRVAEHIGVTRDVSASGIYFEMDSGTEIGSEISFDVEMDTLSGPMKLKCSGVVVRKEQSGSRTGVAVRMLESKFEAVSE